MYLFHPQCGKCQPSSATVSGLLNAKRKDFAGSYQSDEALGTSAFTYKHGWKAVIDFLSPIMCIYENMKGATERNTDAVGYKHPPAIDTVVKDANASGYHFAWSLLDSQDFLVRHRRNRVWGVAAINSGQQTDAEFQDLYKHTISSLQTHCHFSMRDTFGHYAKEEPRSSREKKASEGIPFV
eukprot:s954_g4.t1